MILLREKMEERSSAEHGATALEQQIKESALDMNLQELGERDEMENFKEKKCWLSMKQPRSSSDSSQRSATYPQRLPEIIVLTGIEYLLND
ncbi:hypothetical protein C8R46DRAFT_1214865 [Mycena filopes]|nr:hypothetical protein C8R46DRAFT_1214865 [Mycena filopes]